jgi:hypothetical protein
VEAADGNCTGGAEVREEIRNQVPAGPIVTIGETTSRQDEVRPGRRAGDAALEPAPRTVSRRGVSAATRRRRDGTQVARGADLEREKAL